MKITGPGDKFDTTVGLVVPGNCFRTAESNRYFIMPIWRRSVAGPPPHGVLCINLVTGEMEDLDFGLKVCLVSHMEEQK